MSTETASGPLGEVRAASTAGTGTALTTSAVRVPLWPGTKTVQVIPRNFAGADAVQWLPCPYLTILKSTNLLTSQAALTNYSREAQDNDTATSVVLSSLDTLANGDALYVGSHVPFSGVDIDVDAANGTANALTVAYWKSDLTWADISATDNTDTGASLAVDGTVTWTVPSDWITAALEDTQTGANLAGLGVLSHPMYWTRWVWSVALDASTTLDSMIAIPRSTVYADIPSGMMEEFAVKVGAGGASALQFRTDAGTANVVVNCQSRTTDGRIS